jgi:hypothetical protein
MGFLQHRKWHKTIMKMCNQISTLSPKKIAIIKTIGSAPKVYFQLCSYTRDYIPEIDRPSNDSLFIPLSVPSSSTIKKKFAL